MKLPYFKLSEAWDDFIIDAECEQGVKKLNGFAKLIGKTVANSGLLAVDATVTLVQNVPAIIGEMAQRTLTEGGSTISDERRVKLEEMSAKGREHTAKKMEKEKAEEIKAREVELR
ncbi:MAG: hypothetical protein RLY95_1151 [Pseudomonadota bacterium]|jgi:hypothetical protein